MCRDVWCRYVPRSPLCSYRYAYPYTPQYLYHRTVIAIRVVGSDVWRVAMCAPIHSSLGQQLHLIAMDSNYISLQCTWARTWSTHRIT